MTEQQAIDFIKRYYPAEAPTKEFIMLNRETLDPCDIDRIIRIVEAQEPHKRQEYYETISNAPLNRCRFAGCRTIESVLKACEKPYGWQL